MVERRGRAAGPERPSASVRRLPADFRTEQLRFFRGSARLWLPLRRTHPADESAQRPDRAVSKAAADPAWHTIRSEFRPRIRRASRLAGVVFLREPRGPVRALADRVG